MKFKIKDILLIATAIILVVISLFILIPFDRESRLERVKNYKIYYGRSDEEIIKTLSKYDMVILESQHYKKEDIKEIKNNDTITFGYIPIIEVNKHDEEFLELLKPKDFIYKDDKKMMSNSNGAYILDFNSENYFRGLLMMVKNRIIDKGFDGVFLDTVGSLENYFEGFDKIKQISRYEVFLKTLRKKYPDKLIIQNRGFTILKDSSYKYVNGVVYENFNYPEVIEEKRYRDRVKLLSRLKKKKGLSIFTISYNNEKEVSEYAKKLGFINLHNQGDISFSKWQ